MKLFIAMSFFVLTASCNSVQKDKKNIILYNQGLSLSPQVDSLLKNYCSKNKGRFYVIFFDKKQDTENGLLPEYRLTFAYSLQTVSSKKINCTGYTYVNDTTPVYLFSGLEDFVKSEQETINDLDFRKLIVWQKSMSYVSTTDTTYSVEGDNYPFMNTALKPPIIFNAPTDSR